MIPRVDHARRAAQFLDDRERSRWHDGAVWFVRQKRDAAAARVAEWEQLRAAAAAIKRHTQGRFADYLEQFERRAQERGMQVHWAADAAEHNRIVHGLLAARGITRVVKSKSMLTEECGLNGYLEARGIEITDTDLGERIVQLAKEPPSHIVMPAIHWRRSEIGELFHEYLGTERGLEDPTALTEAARHHLRERFARAEAAITGVNFAVAEDGLFVVCTNEGNADLGTSLPRMHIACMGIEKIIPRTEDLGVFLRLLARSATGQPITAYTTHYGGPRPGGELHVVMVDNGRTDLLARREFARALACIRCGACLNTCPVYRRSGGHSYGVAVPGPLGSVLAPGRDLRRFQSLPFASSLCGSCTDVCPVQIDLHHQLLAWRAEVVRHGRVGWGRRWLLRAAGFLFRHPGLYHRSMRVLRWSGRRLPGGLLRRLCGVWGREREMPEVPARSFRELYLERRAQEQSQIRNQKRGRGDG